MEYQPPKSDPQTRQQHEIEHGRLIARNAHQIWNWQSPSGRHRARRRGNMFINLGRIRKDLNVLEIGCGTGLFTEMVARKTGAAVTAVDLSPDLLDIARKQHNPANVTYVQGNVEQGEGIEGPYEVIYGSSILHHLDLRLALPHLVRALAAGGRFVFAEPNRRNPQIWMERNIDVVRRRTGTSPDEEAFMGDAIRALLLEHGLVDSRIEPFDWLHPITPGILIGPVSLLGRLFESTPGLRQFGGSLSIYAEKPE